MDLSLFSETDKCKTQLIFPRLWKEGEFLFHYLPQSIQLRLYREEISLCNISFTEEALCRFEEDVIVGTLHLHVTVYFCTYLHFVTFK